MPRLDPSISTTALLDDVAARHGGKVVRVAVGRQAAIDALASHRPAQIAIAGEGTGMERDYDYSSVRHASDLESAEKIGRSAGERAVARLEGRVVNAQPEYEDCEARSREQGVPVKEVLAEAVSAWRTGRPGPHHPR